MENKIEISTNEISKRIYTLRGVQVMLDADLAKIYEVETKRLKEAVRRNRKRFPSDFMFEPSREEFENLETSSEPHTDVRSQIASIRLDAKFQPYMPFVFTEPGITMLSCVLHSQRAIEINIEIMRAFVQLRKQPKGPIQVQHKKPSAPKLADPVEKIQSLVAKHWGLTTENLKSASRTKEISLPRQIAIYLIRKNLHLSLNDIGRNFGQRDHTTILHAYRKIEAACAAENTIQETVDFLKDEIRRQSTTTQLI